MRKSIMAFVLIAFLFCGNAIAQSNRYGIGVIFIEPTGLSAKFWMQKTAIHAACGWSSQKGIPFLLQADYLFPQINLFQDELSRIFFSFGLGGRMTLKNDIHFGLRLPFALDFLSRKVSLNLFLELVPILNLESNPNFDLKGALGIRYLFK
jgi:hypothetical protein